MEISLSISDLFDGMISRQEIVCTFLAVLELMKLNSIKAIQNESFGSIMIESTKTNLIIEDIDTNEKEV